MTKDVIALTPRLPDVKALLAGLFAGGPDTRVTSVGQGAVIQLSDDTGRPLLSVEAPIYVEVPGEVRRLLGPDAALPEGPVWWTEARASTAIEGAERLAGSFAGRLAAVLDGTTWPPDAGTTDVVLASGGPSDASPPSGAPPAVEVLTDSAALVLQDRPLIPLSGWLADALRTAADSGRALQLVTPATSRLTLAARTALRGHPNRWVVHDETGGYYDGLSGALLRWGGSAFVPETPAVPGETNGDQTPGLALAFTGPAPAATAASGSPGPGPAVAGDRQLILSLRTEYPAEADLVLGRGLEAAWQALTGAAPAGWGTAEPINLPWSPRQLTDLARARVPRPTWLLAVGHPDRPALATLDISRTRNGVGEDITLALGYGADEEPPREAVDALAETLVTRYGLTSMLVSLRAACRDLTVPPRFEPPPVPLTFVLGAGAVQQVGLAHAQRPPLPLVPVPLGPAARPGLSYTLGDGSDPRAWTALRSLTRHLRSPSATH
ncbi:hypothetical protein H8N00_00285 [Streptomyces sp. AC563]|uniref:DUF6177 family protein n=1 Tax=Streptomyces buecherae TaxID=2763006 RepID=UPI00164E9E0C|nr:DUF6177 family protein [Streptomyces buecherae]MBC3987375.1 hypothetical protein [Streptomyces buecherae]